MLDDILKLQLVRNAGTGHDTYLRSTLDAGSGTLTVTTERGFPGQLIPAPNGTVVQHLLWDNSACGLMMPLTGNVVATLDEDAGITSVRERIARNNAGQMKALLDVVLGGATDRRRLEARILFLTQRPARA